MSKEYIIEYARSGRANCRGTCHKKIEKGELRLGSIATNPTYESVYWRHWNCRTAAVMKNIEDVSHMSGFGDLSNDDQIKLKKTFEDFKLQPPPTKSTKSKRKGDELDENKVHEIIPKEDKKISKKSKK